MNRKVGHRFHPTDEEIINYFLKKKVVGHDSEVDSDIAEVEICKCEPWELPNHAVNKLDDDPLWFFFCKRGYKYNNSRRANRTTKAGYWKVTGKDRKIWTRKGTKQEIGIKKTLVFYKGRVPNGIRTNWVIHEYHPTAPDFPKQRAYVVCRLKKKTDDKADNSTPDEGESSSHVHFDYESISENTTPQDNSPLLLNPESLLEPTYNSPSTLQSQMHMEQDQNLNQLQYYVHSSEQEVEDLINSLFVDPFEETVPTHHSGSSPSKSLKRVYVEDSSGTDAKSFLVQSQMHMEQGQHLNQPQYYVDSSEQEVEDLINSLFVDPFEETVHTHHSGSSPSKSLKRVCVEDSSGTDAKSFLAQSQIHMEQGQNLYQLQYHVDSSEQEVEDLTNSLFVDPFEETVPTHHSGSIPSKALKSVYVEDSSGTDAESFLAQGTSMGGNVRTKEYRHMQVVPALSGTLPSTNCDYSVDSFTHIPEINGPELVSDEIPTRKSQYHPRSHKILAEEVVPTSCWSA